MNNNTSWYRYILVPVSILMIIGLIMVFSSSGIYAKSIFGNTYFFLNRQIVFCLLGIITIFIVSNIPTNFFYSTRYFWLFVCIVLLLITLSPLGKKVNGSSRWISIMGFSLQPMEFVKVFLIVYFAWFFGEKQSKIERFSIGFIPPIVVTLIFAILLILQPDFGGALFVCATFFFMSLIGGTRFLYWVSSLLLFSGSAVLMVITSEYRLKRWKAFLHPFKHAKEEGYQIVQSIYGLAHGGFKGTGLGFGKQKLFFLPEAHTDFILSVLGEEIGFLGMSVVFICIATILFMGMKFALSLSDIKDKFLISGITFMVVFSAMLNFAVVLGMIPPKGLAMPFISYGGSSFLSLSLAIGLFLSVVKRSVKK